MLDSAEYASEDQIAAAFQRLDFDNKGSIDASYLADLLSNTYGDDARLSAHSIADGRDSIDLATFQRVMRAASASSEEAMLDASNVAPARRRHSAVTMDQARRVLDYGVSS